MMVMSIGSHSKPAFAWPSLLLVAVMIQSCSVISGSSQRLVSDLRETEAFSKLTPAVNGAVLGRESREENAASSHARPSALRNIGDASWYGPGFRGKKTASGDTFDDEKFTAAHKTLPLGSKVRVTNLSNRKVVEVEINDRGPFVEGRIIDLSQAAARTLGMVDGGTAKVQIELLRDDWVSEKTRNSSRR